MIVEAEVTGLLGEFDHRVELKEGWEFVIAFGLNGVGKTKFLELINATMNADLPSVAAVQFSKLRLTSDSGEVLDVTRVHPDDDPLWSLFDAVGPAGEVDRLDPANRAKVEPVSVKLTFVLTSPNGERVTWTDDVRPGTDAAFERFLARNTTWVPLQGTLWEDRSDGEISDIEDLKRIYGTHRGERTPLPRQRSMKSELVKFLAGNRTYLIETQRLGLLAAARGDRAAHSQSSPKWTVDGYANDLKQRLQRALADNSLKSQKLDRTFPERLLQDSPSTTVDTATITDAYAELNQVRKRLADIGLTDAEDRMSFEPDQLEGWQRDVFWTYIRDSREKLATFDSLRKKINLLEALVNRRFLRKHIKVSAKEGLTVRSTTSGATIPPSGLSSGEQHELVLIYNLLFRVEQGSLVLIDEPEISLHISWQAKFLEDLKRIGESSNLRFIVATHSPSIIDKWWSRTVQLGPTESDDA